MNMEMGRDACPLLNSSMKSKRFKRYSNVLSKVLRKCREQNDIVPNARTKGSCGTECMVMRDLSQSCKQGARETIDDGTRVHKQGARETIGDSI